ncbi:hypothetical protein GGR57DRAFT_521127 [Xylariaceae sp. FL1272]|nr:hypothetical protein GGR57DRAFT_521127 [Xylariaceae sp. FL1272]
MDDFGRMDSFILGYYAPDLPAPLPVFTTEKGIFLEPEGDWDEVLTDELPSGGSRASRIFVRFGTLVIQYGSLVDISEAKALYFLNRHTSLRVPKLYAAEDRSGLKFLYMEYLKGWETWEYRCSLLSECAKILEDAPTFEDAKYRVTQYVSQHSDQCEIGTCANSDIATNPVRNL